MEEYIIAIDPGRDKTGIALVCKDLTAKAIKIVKSTELKANLWKWLDECKKLDYNIKTIVLGNGTCSDKYYKELDTWFKNSDINIVIVNEYNTTAEGRLRYWEYNKPQGLKKILPTSWLTPPVPVDDYTAWIIGERYFRGKINDENK